ncbi:hypothetical protein GYMLUDRAFT_330547 [Collybiopsis luxurians FD-317 M1]|nr:hypothetical protein GYMLUDRAFT_330547 [Collybiopsis luxurians FD-317 M1]
MGVQSCVVGQKPGISLFYPRLFGFFFWYFSLTKFSKLMNFHSKWYSRVASSTEPNWKLASPRAKCFSMPAKLYGAKSVYRRNSQCSGQKVQDTK